MPPQGILSKIPISIPVRAKLLLTGRKLFPFVTLSGAHLNSLPKIDPWRGVEGSRQSILCRAATGNSFQNPYLNPADVEPTTPAPFGGPGLGFTLRPAPAGRTSLAQAREPWENCAHQYKSPVGGDTFRKTAGGTALQDRTHRVEQAFRRPAFNSGNNKYMGFVTASISRLRRPDKCQGMSSLMPATRLRNRFLAPQARAQRQRSANKEIPSTVIGGCVFPSFRKPLPGYVKIR
jgi:hypothetical protein